jgi:uncharacterized protein
MKVYLDIESDRSGNVCVIGMFLPSTGFVQFYGNEVTTQNVVDVLMKATTIVTFNGDGFDLPLLNKFCNLDISLTHHSVDLHKVKKSLGIKGGLKELEKLYGIPRKTEGIDGYKAIILWERYLKKGRLDALRLLLEYNKEDVLNLVYLEKIFLDQMEVAANDRAICTAGACPEGLGRSGDS